MMNYEFQFLHEYWNVTHSNIIRYLCLVVISERNGSLIALNDFDCIKTIIQPK